MNFIMFLYCLVTVSLLLLCLSGFLIACFVESTTLVAGFHSMYVLLGDDI